MRALVIIGNNLQYDTRVKRQILLLTEVFDEVVVAAKPVPDRTEWVHHPKVQTVFCEWVLPNYPCGNCLVEKAERMGLARQICSIAPMLLDSQYLEMEHLKEERQLQARLMMVERWDILRAAHAEEMSMPEEMIWAVTFLANSICWAEQVVNLPADVVYCNDVDTLVCGVAHKKRYKSRMIYDIHDIFYDYAPGVFPRMHRYQLALTEWKFISWADVVVGVSQSEINYLKRQYELTVPVLYIPNCTMERTRGEPAQKDFHTPIRFYYHGIADATRGIEDMIEAISSIPDSRLVLRCLPCPYVDGIRQLVKTRGMEERVQFLEPVAAEQIPAAASADGDVGLILYKQDGKESIASQFSLNNKFIEYLRAGLPIISYTTQEHEMIIQKYRCGILIGQSNAGNLQKAMRELCKNPQVLAQMSKNACRASEELFEWNYYKKQLQKAVLSAPIRQMSGGDMGDIWAEVAQDMRCKNEKLTEQIAEDRRSAERTEEDLKNQILDWAHTAEELNRRIVALEQQIIDAEKTRVLMEESYQSSTSWRITKPLRMLGRILKR